MNDDSKIIKQKNYQKIYRLFFENNLLSKPQIAEKLNLSLPTVTSNITTLIKEGLITKGENLNSEGGRPALGYTLNLKAKIAFAVEIKFNQVRCAIVDLMGNMSDLAEYALPCNDSHNYLKNFCQIVKSYLANFSYTKESVLGIGISVQALVNGEGTRMIYSMILPLISLHAEDLTREFGYKVRLCHDVECAALRELWTNADLKDAFYLSIGEHLGGALIYQHSIEHGKKGYAGAIEHIEIGNEGRQCYCGRTDCLETYCSISALLSPREKIKEFFNVLRCSNALSEEHNRWHTYLNYLAKGLYIVYLTLERDIILGGDLAPYINENDINVLEDLIIKRSSFPIERGFIKKATVLNNAALIGAGMFFIKDARNEMQSLL